MADPSVYRIPSTRAGFASALAFAGSRSEYDADLELEVQTKKVEAKLVPCRSCRRPLVVNRFYTPAIASCSECNLPKDYQSVGMGDGGAGVTRAILDEVQARFPTCRCEIEPGIAKEDLQALGAGCTKGDGRRAGWVCACLDTIRRRVA